MSYVVRFFRFWYDFVVGDDWTVALTVILAVALTFAAAHRGVLAWWILPVVVGGSLSLSVLQRAAPRSENGGRVIDRSLRHRKVPARPVGSDRSSIRPIDLVRSVGRKPGPCYSLGSSL